MSSISSNPELPSVVRESLDRLRKMISRYVLMQALCLTAILGVSIFWLAGFIDYFPVLMGASESPKWARIVMLVILFASMAHILYWVGLNKWSVRWQDSSLALLLERKFPQFRHALITTVQANERGKQNSASDTEYDPQLIATTQQEAVAAIKQIDLDSVIYWKPLQWQAGLLGGMLAFSLLVALLQPAWTLHWSKRLFGLSNDAWPRMSRIQIDGIEIDIPRFTGESEMQRYLRPFVDGKISMPRGQSGRLLAYADLTAKQVPDACMLTYRGADSRQGRASLRRLNAQGTERLPFVLEGPPMESIDQAFSLALQGGDARIAGLRLDVIDAPQLNELRLEVRYPPYLRRRATSLWLDETVEYRTGLRLPQGTDITLVGAANMPLNRCECRVTHQNRDGQSISELREADGEGQSFRLPIGKIDSNFLLEFRLWEASGHCATRIQQYVLGMLPDDVPSVDLVMAGIGSSITEQAILPIEAKVLDDHDVAQSRIELFLNESPPVSIPSDVSSNGNVRQSIDLRNQRDLGQIKVSAGQTLGLTLVAEDFYDLETNERVGRSSPIQLAVVTPNQLLVLLERRELAMRSRMELVISELNQLRELLLKIRQTNRPESGQNGGNEKRIADAANEELVREKLQALRAQQATSQTEKSDGELLGVEVEIAQIRQELINNRIDSQDRQERLENRVRLPIQNVRKGSLAKTTSNLRLLEKSLANGPVEDTRVGTTLDLLSETLLALEAILQGMVDIQDFNEVVDMVRSMIDDQGKIIDRTKSEQKKRVLDMFK